MTTEYDDNRNHQTFKTAMDLLADVKQHGIIGVRHTSVSTDEMKEVAEFLGALAKYLEKQAARDAISREEIPRREAALEAMDGATKRSYVTDLISRARDSGVEFSFDSGFGSGFRLSCGEIPLVLECELMAAFDEIEGMLRIAA